MKIKIIAAISKNNIIGSAENSIPWEFHSEDMKIFSEKTKSEGAVIVIGRKTFFSIPENFRPLKNRRNIILSKNQNFKINNLENKLEIFNDKEKLLEKLKEENIETLWVCGGGQIYKEFFGLVEELHISHFDILIKEKEENISFPEIDKNIWKEISSFDFKNTEKSPAFTHKVYKKHKI